MLSTKELEQYIKNEISCKLKDVSWDKINFKEGNENSPEGTYIFSKNGKYHIIFAEKGKIREDKITSEIKEVLWNVLDIISFDMAMEYAIHNRVENKDFRHALFEKEIKIYSLFGEEFEQKKCLEIAEILEKNPYNDSIIGL